MRTLASTSFMLFLCTLIYKMTSQNALLQRQMTSHSQMETLLKTSPGPSFFDQKDEEEIHDKLGDLDDLSGDLASDDSKTNLFIDKKAEKRLALERLSELQNELQIGYMAEVNNIDQLPILQNKIAEIKDAQQIPLLPIEKWDVEVVFYFIIEERLTLDEINQVNLLDLGIDAAKWKNIVFEAKTGFFRQKILNFKNIKTISMEEKEKSDFIAHLEKQLLSHKKTQNELAQVGVVPPSQRSKVDQINYSREQLEEMYAIPTAEEPQF